jgi:MSHA biogenesis protein MshJ
MVSEKLREIAARIGMMSLRERVFIFAASVVVILALVQTLLIDAGQAGKQQAINRVQVAEEALVQIGQQRQQLERETGHNPDRVAREALAGQEARLAALNAELDRLHRSLIPPERMNQVLKSVVQEQSGIRVVGFKTLSPQPVALPDAAEGTPPGFYRHGFEVKVSGRYSELVTYLERLEALPWRLNWVEATLDAEARPMLTLTLTVHTLSLEETWLRV